MKIGVLSLGWPPVWAGGETYLYRIVNALNQNGVDAWGITATKANSDYDSGDSQVMRIVPPFAPEITKDTIKIMFQDTYDNYRSLSKEEQIKAEKASVLTARYLWNFLSGMTSKHKLEQIAA